MLLTLNDDCLFYICEYLNFSDQSSLAHTCQRLQAVVEDNWSRSCRKVNLDREPCWWFEQENQYFMEFMRCICENVEQLQFFLKSKTFHTLKGLIFPKTTKLIINSWFNNAYLDDKELKRIVKLFPQLTTLSLHCGSITGNYLWNLKNLKALELDRCKDLKTKHFKKIFSTLRLRKLNLIYYAHKTYLDRRIADITACKTLEEIRIDDQHLLLMIEQLSKLKQLKKLIVYTHGGNANSLEEIVIQFGDSMDTIILDDVACFYDEHCRSIQSMRNLRRLLLRNYCILGEQLVEIGKSLANSLQEFRLIKGLSNRAEEDDIIEFLNDCKNLEIFDISYYGFAESFLNRIIKRLDFRSRKKALKICCFGTNITDEDATHLTIPNMLEVSLAKEHVQFPGQHFFQCEWKLPVA